MTTRRNARPKRIAELNDKLRREPLNRSLGQVLVSSGIAAEGETFKAETLTKLAAMTPKDFKKGNDPYGERDFNSFSVGGRLCFFKIDYYAKGDLRLASDDPADPSKTERVMTIMLADEY